VPLALAPVRAVLGGAGGPALVAALGATARVQLVAGLGLAVGIALG
jgi:1,4-dihydroxy-2-naphthoate octaprenyltransferase